MVMVYDNEYTILLVTLYSSKSRSFDVTFTTLRKVMIFRCITMNAEKLWHIAIKFEIRQPLDVFYKIVLKYTNGQNMP